MTDTYEPTASEKRSATRKRNKADKEVLAEARERYDDWLGRDGKNRENHKKCTAFVYTPGSQWDEKVKEVWGKDTSYLEFPQLKQFVNQLSNDQRQNRPGIQVHPAGKGADEDSAKLRQGVVRHIEVESQAEAAYDQAFNHAVVGGRGYWRVCSEYESPKSFNQKLVIKPVHDALSVLMDPDFQAPDGSDACGAFVTESLTRKEFERRYPKATALSWDADSKWYGDDRVTVADYYRRVCTPRTLEVYEDGTIRFEDDEQPAPEGVPLQDSREVEDYTVEWFKIAGGDQILETYEWPGTMIPVVCCMGDVIVVDGERQFQGLILQALDAQKMYNYEKTMKAKALALAARAPWVAPQEAIAGYEKQWQGANKADYSVLPYNSVDAQGNPIAAPTRVQPPTVATGWVEASQSDKDDIKSIIGMYQNSLGMHGQEVSGKAILAREKQGDNATFHFADNLSRAIALTGRILLELIPHYYDMPRTVNTVHPDGTHVAEDVNKPAFEIVDGVVLEVTEHDMSAGDYAVVVEAGPSYATAREQTRESLMALVQANPQAMAFAMDIIVGAMDFPDKEELSERFKAMLPPQIQQQIQAKEQGQAPVPPEVQAQMQQMQQQLQAADQAVQQLQQENQQLKSGVQLKLQAAQQEAQIKQESAQMDAQQKAEQAKMENDAKLVQAHLDAQVAIKVAMINAEAKQRVAEIEANAGLMQAGLEAALTPVPNALPGETDA